MKSITSGTQIVCDHSTAYNSMRNNNMNYSHETVNHSKNVINPITGNNIKTIKGFWSWAKNVIFETHMQMIDTNDLFEILLRHYIRDQNPIKQI